MGAIVQLVESGLVLSLFKYTADFPAVARNIRAGGKLVFPV
jgi:hypothetical protein